MNAQERTLLRDLAQKVRELAAQPQMDGLRKSWYALNDGKPDRPLIVMKFHGVYSDVYPQPVCEDPLARELEGAFLNLLTEAGWKDDRVIEPEFSVNLSFSFTPFGIPVEKKQALDAHGKPTMGYLSHHIIADLEEDFHLLGKSTWNIEKEYAHKQALFAAANEAFGDILTVKYRTPAPSYAPATALVELMGMENMLLALYDAPEHFAKALDMQTDDWLEFLSEIEARGLVAQNTDASYVGQDSYGYSRQLAEVGARQASFADGWGYANSQETVGISPQMFDEVFFPSIARYAARFGLFAFGCCEPVHPLWERSLSRLPNLRKVSVSPWCDEEAIAGYIRGKGIVYHRKPSPNGFAAVQWDEEALRAQIAKTARAARGCPLEITFRDITTVHGDSTRLGKAVEIARRAAMENWQP